MTKSCVLNLGLYRTGSTTFATASEKFGWKVDRTFPHQGLNEKTLRQFLVEPKVVIHQWWFHQNGKEHLMKRISDEKNDLLGDGYIPLLCFLPSKEIINFVKEVKSKYDIDIIFLATTRNVNDLILSELHHWVRHDIERKAGLLKGQGQAVNDRTLLEHYLEQRAVKHRHQIFDQPDDDDDYADTFPFNVTELRLEEIQDWPQIMTDLCLEHGISNISGEGNKGSGAGRRMMKEAWERAFRQAGQQNRSPSRPLEGILLTMRIGASPSTAQSRVRSLFKSLSEDRLARFMVVLAIDNDEEDKAQLLVNVVKEFTDQVELIINPPPKKTNNDDDPEGAETNHEPFPICRVWDEMAIRAFRTGADWVVLLGDDIDIECSFHYRAFYRSFLDIQERCGTTGLWFGCPWWNDLSFPGFPTFPVVGKEHYKIFGSLIPKHRSKNFVNQDLDPYLQRLYLKFGAAPLVAEAKLRNMHGGDTVNPPRYQPVQAKGWRDWVIDDVSLIREYYVNGKKIPAIQECTLLDVIVPSYRISMKHLLGICRLKIPTSFRTSFIIIVDNPKLLVELYRNNDIDQASRRLEGELATATGNKNIRVRCNGTNLGASASRNRGIDESSAEYVLFLDDDVVPEDSLLEAYKHAINDTDNDDTVGYLGLVKFPRSSKLPILHAGVLMSYLTFMFEIAESPMYKNPAWGVTANLCVRRLPGIHFDTAYAKTGGGEDVDFCLRLTAATQGKEHLLSVPTAKVVHEFWPGGLRVLIPHFFNWAVGDGALYKRHPGHTYLSWPNAAEVLAIIIVPLTLVLTLFLSVSICLMIVFECSLGVFLIDLIVDMSNRHEFDHRKRLLLLDDDGDKNIHFSKLYYITAHILANFYVIVLEFGRLYGHVRRGECMENIFRRFDWHCGRLPNAKNNFIQREFVKFSGFLAILLLVSSMHAVTFVRGW